MNLLVFLPVFHNLIVESLQESKKDCGSNVLNPMLVTLEPKHLILKSYYIL